MSPGRGPIARNAARRVSACGGESPITAPSAWAGGDPQGRVVERIEGERDGEGSSPRALRRLRDKGREPRRSGSAAGSSTGTVSVTPRRRRPRFQSPPARAPTRVPAEAEGGARSAAR